MWLVLVLLVTRAYLEQRLLAAGRRGWVMIRLDVKPQGTLGYYWLTGGWIWGPGDSRADAH